MRRAHGSTDDIWSLLTDEERSMILSAAANGVPMCCESTVVDDIVLARRLRWELRMFAYDATGCRREPHGVGGGQGKQRLDVDEERIEEWLERWWEALS